MEESSDHQNKNLKKAVFSSNCVVFLCRAVMRGSKGRPGT